MKKTASKLEGLVFGRLTVIKRLENNKHKKTVWECLCSCGNITNATANSLIQKKINILWLF
jgi:hypothetical protein